jgi:hypothetical protein
VDYSIHPDSETSVRLFASYYAMRELPDILETSLWVTRGRVTVGALRYTRPHAPDGTRFQASYHLPVTEETSVNIGALHETGLGLPRPINAVLLQPTVELQDHLFLDGKVVIPTHGAIRAALSLRLTF